MVVLRFSALKLNGEDRWYMTAKSKFTCMQKYGSTAPNANASHNVRAVNTVRIPMKCFTMSRCFKTRRILSI